MFVRAVFCEGGIRAESGRNSFIPEFANYLLLMKSNTRPIQLRSSATAATIAFHIGRICNPVWTGFYAGKLFGAGWHMDTRKRDDGNGKVGVGQETRTDIVIA